MNGQRRTARALVRRDAPPHRHQGDLAGRTARGVPRSASSGSIPRSTPSPRCASTARARRPRPPRQAVRRGEDLPLLHGLPTGIKDLEETKGLLTTYGSPLYRDFVPEPRQRHGRPRARRRRDRRRQDQRAGIRRRLEQPQSGVGRDRQSVQSRCSTPAARRAARRWRSRPTCCRSAPAPTPAARCATPPSFCGVVGFRPSPGMVAVERRALGWTPISVLGPMGRSVADVCLLYATQIGQHDMRSASASRSSREALCRTVAGRSRQPARRLHRGFRRRAGREGHPRRPSARRSRR